MKKFLLVCCFAFFTVMSIVAQDSLDNKVNIAVKGLANRLQRKLDVNIKEVTLAGTNDMTTELSLKLSLMIKLHAVNQSMFNVVTPPPLTRSQIKSNEQSIGIISGTYTINKNDVDVYLDLSVDGAIKNSTHFNISMNELSGIAIVPDNLKTSEEAKKRDEEIAVITETSNQVLTEETGKQQINSPRMLPNVANTNITSQNIKIIAKFDSKLGSRLYMHREPLELEIMVDKDCYFKVYSINANNEPPKLIYPNTTDTNNRLFANRPRNIFETAKYYLYRPYGIETIWIVASTNQFVNIEQEYITPWSADAINANLRGRNRGDLEIPNGYQTVSDIGDVYYTINILPPHEEHIFGKPDDMKKCVEMMQKDTIENGGQWNISSTTKSGYSIVNNVRISYNNPTNAPDTIEFAYYRLNELLGGQNVNVQTRGSSRPHTFEIDRPRNITQTIQTVRSGIERNGGSFQGNEQQGNFKANGIEGMYLVSENVKVTITDKPVLVPNSLIENKVRSYFGGR